MGNMAIPASIIIAGAMIAIAILIAGRWEISSGGNAAWQLDHWTGNIKVCGMGANASKLSCHD
jgi:hypothetical protein